jgi:polar amino acid transport system substrate-binding protein
MLKFNRAKHSLLLRRRVQSAASIAALVIFSIAAGTAQAGDCPDNFRIAYTDVALSPYILGEGAELSNPPGLFVTWARTALERMGCQQGVTEVRLPYNRIVSSMANGDIDARVTGAYRDDVASIMAFPMVDGALNRAMAVAEAATALYVNKNAPEAEWDGRVLRFTGNHPTIGAVRGHYTEKLVRTRKWDVDSAPTWESNIKKLLLGRVGAIVGPDSVVEALSGFEQLQRLEPPLATDLYFAPVSRQFYARHTAFATQFWLEICRESRAKFRKLPTCSAK